MTEQPPPNPNQEFRVAFKAQVYGTLVATAIVAAAGFAISKLSKVSFEDLLLYVGVPAIALTLLIGAGMAMRLAWRTANGACGKRRYRARSWRCTSNSINMR